MIKKFTLKYIRLFLLFLLCSKSGFSQNSVLVNFGDTSCGGPAPVSFSLIKDPLTPTPSLLNNCVLSAQLPDFYFVFIAYNPLNQKIYFADTRTGTTKIWVLDMGLPANISCPASIPVLPDFSYNYVSNNFEFDNNGNLWSLSGYNSGAGQSEIDNFDPTTGTIISSRALQFPAGNFPSTVYSGDITILPNGRMFAVLGIPSKLYEINNYSGSAASAVFLQDVPKNCYGLAYLNGELELTGFDGLGCYHYEYSIGSNTLGPEQPFQKNQTPVDNTSIDPSIGTAKQLLNATTVNANTADLTYAIFVKNFGNVHLNDISLVDDLGAAFGAGNVSNVSIAFPLGPVPPGITLNPSYNGTTDTQLLTPGGVLVNQSAGNSDYSFSILLRCTVTNLNPSLVYLNSAVAAGSIGNAANNSLLAVSDSSNNGNSSATDPNNDSNPSKPGENTPTPYVFSILPVHFINITAHLLSQTSSQVDWSVATPTQDANSFEPEYSTDAIHWTTLTHINITDPTRANYNAVHVNIPPGTVFYRVKQIDNNGSYIYSRTVALHTGSGAGTYAVYPNPAGNYINIISTTNASHADAELYDAIGRLILKTNIISANQQINCSALPNGEYFLKIMDDRGVNVQKIMVRH
jgi:hypothetical protein